MKLQSSIIVAILIGMIFIGIGTDSDNPLSARVHELDDSAYRSIAQKHGVDPDAFNAFALHRDGRCEDVYVNGLLIRTTEQQGKMVRIAACNGDKIAQE